MEEGRPSRTAWSVACRRAAHRLFDTPPYVFDDPVSLRILGPNAEQMLRDDHLRHESIFGRAMRAFLLVRSRYAEDRLHEAVARGVGQYLVLGAGLDTFAYRNPYHADQLQVYEVDHPATQAWKRKLLAEAGLAAPGNVHYVAVDFEKDRLSDALAAAGFRADAPACVSWLGVTPYLTLDGFCETVSALGSLAPGSSLTFEYALDLSLLSEQAREVVEALMKQVSSIGEPFRLSFTPQSVAAELRTAGFTDVDEMLADTLNPLYFANRTDGLKLLGDSARLVTARR